MTFLRAILLLVCVLFGTGCDDPRERVEEALKGKDGLQLRRDAALIYKEMYSRSGRSEFVEEISARKWPKSFQKLRPIHVGAYRDGFTIALRTSEGGESGVYVVPESMDYEPKPGPGVTYEKLAEGIFWFRFDG